MATAIANFTSWRQIKKSLPKPSEPQGKPPIPTPHPIVKQFAQRYPTEDEVATAVATSSSVGYRWANCLTMGWGVGMGGLPCGSDGFGRLFLICLQDVKLAIAVANSSSVGYRSANGYLRPRCEIG